MDDRQACAKGGGAEYLFGPFRLIPARRVLLRGEVPQRIGGRALDILATLVAHAGRLVSKRELFAAVWPDRVVEECNLRVNMAALRRVLGDGCRQGRYIATVDGRGYCFVAEVRALQGRAAPPPERAMRLVSIRTSGGPDGATVCELDLRGLAQLGLAPAVVAAAIGLELGASGKPDLAAVFRSAGALLMLGSGATCPEAGAAPDGRLHAAAPRMAPGAIGQELP